jgi:lysophospholipase L1-like esterase
MAPLPVFNRAFGGSRTAEVLYYMDRIVLPYEPAIIVYYCGSNDINAGERPLAIFGRFREFSERVQSRLPQTHLLYVSINRAPQKKDRWDLVDSTNGLVLEYCTMTANRIFIDVNPVLFDEGDRPRLDMYVSDQLHLTDKAYEEFTAVIKPVVEGVWRKKTRK